VRTAIAFALAGALLLGYAAPARADLFIVNVGSGGNSFNPQTLSIHTGDTVVFVNKGGYHNVVADDNSFRCARGCDGDGHGGSGAASSSNWVASLTFANAGTIGYFCETHGAPGEGMYGTINVTALQPPPAVTSAPLGGWPFGALLGGALVLTAMIERRRRRAIKPETRDP
jgi:plastocyanin